MFIKLEKIIFLYTTSAGTQNALFSAIISNLYVHYNGDKTVTKSIYSKFFLKTIQLLCHGAIIMGKKLLSNLYIPNFF